jgi:hypothetical protein
MFSRRLLVLLVGTFTSFIMWLLCFSTAIQCACFMLSILVLKLFSWKFIALFFGVDIFFYRYAR